MNLSSDDCLPLRLVLGVGRSGTNWMSRVLSQSSTPLRFLNEPLFHLRPKLPGSPSSDHTAFAYASECQPIEPLIDAYRYLSSPQQKSIVRCERDDDHAQLALIKEVHSLLALPALLRQADIRAVLVVRDPVYVTDSIFDAQGLETLYLKNEARYLNDEALCRRLGLPKRFHKELARLDPTRRSDLVLRTALSVAVIQRLMDSLAEQDNIYLVSYEQVCRKPEMFFQEMARHFGLNWSTEETEYLKQTTSGQSGTYEIVRNTEHQLDRPLRFLRGEEVKEIQSCLEAYSLDEWHPRCTESRVVAKHDPLSQVMEQAA